MSRILLAGTEKPPLSRAESLKRTLNEYPQLYQWIAEGKIRRMIKDTDLPLPPGFLQEIESTAGNFFQTSVMKYWNYQVPNPLAQGINATLDSATRAAAKRFASLSTQKRKEVLDLIPDLAYIAFSDELDRQIDTMDPAQFPAVKRLTDPSTQVDIPGLSKQHNQMLTNLIGGYFKSLEINQKKKVIGALLALPAKASEAKQLSTALQNSGPVLQKVLQLVGKKSDSEIVREAAKDLLSSIKEFDPATARKILRQELGRPIEEVFSVFEEKPLAAASVGQVHRAKLKGSDDWVIVKLLRPGIAEAAAAELKVLRKFATDELSKDLLNKLETNLMNEIDLRKEAANVENAVFYTNKKQGIRIASVITSVPATKNMLVTKLALGRPINFEKNHSLNELMKKGTAISRLLKIWLQEAVFGNGFFHADLHEGNLFWATQEGKQAYLLTLIDFGSAGKISPDERRSFAKLFMALGLRDPSQVSHSLGSIFNFTEGQLKAVDAELKKIVTDKKLKLAQKTDAIIALVIQMGGKVPESLMMFNRGKSFLENHLEQINGQMEKWDPARKYRRFFPERTYIQAALGALNVEAKNFLFDGEDYQPSIAAQAFFDFTLAYGKKIYNYLKEQIVVTTTKACVLALRAVGFHSQSTNP